jgi:hypothetical protein
MEASRNLSRFQIGHYFNGFVCAKKINRNLQLKLSAAYLICCRIIVFVYLLKN